MKYIMFEAKDGRKVPLIFPEELVHAEVAGWARRIGKPVSAGQVTVVALDASGHSETLGIKADELDRQTINCHPYSKGLETGMEAQIEKLLLVRSAELMLAVFS